MAKSIEQMADELADREGIRELPLKYCDCVWRSDITGIVDSVRRTTAPSSRRAASVSTLHRAATPCSSSTADYPGRDHAAAIYPQPCGRVEGQRARHRPLLCRTAQCQAEHEVGRHRLLRRRIRKGRRQLEVQVAHLPDRLHGAVLRAGNGPARRRSGSGCARRLNERVAA